MLLMFVVYKMGNAKGKVCVLASRHVVVVLLQPRLLLLAKHLLEEERWEINGFLEKL